MTTNTTLNLSNVQETIEDSIKNARRIGRKGVMAYVGLLGMAYDFTTKDGGKWLTKAEKRGERVEKELTTQVSKLQDQALSEYKSLRNAVGERINQTNGDLSEVVEKLQAGLQKFVRRGNLNASETMQEIEINAMQALQTAQVETEKVVKNVAATTKTKVKQAAKKTVKTIDRSTDAVANAIIEAVEKVDLPEIEQPFADYDKLAWNQIVAKVATMDDAELVKVRVFELATRKRPSILKAVDAKLEPSEDAVTA